MDHSVAPQKLTTTIIIIGITRKPPSIMAKGAA